MRNQGRKSPGGDSRKSSGAGRGSSSKPSRTGDSRGKSDSKFGGRDGFKSDKPSGDKKFGGPRKDFGSDKPFSDRKPTSSRGKDFGPEKSFSDRKPTSSRGKDFGSDKPFSDRKPTGPRGKDFGSDKPFGDKKFSSSRGKDFKSDKPFSDKPRGKDFGDKSFSDKKFGGKRDGDKSFGDKKFDGKREPSSFSRNKFASEKPAARGKSSYKDFEQRGKTGRTKSDEAEFNSEDEPKRAFGREDDFRDEKPKAKKSVDGGEKKPSRPRLDEAKKSTSKYQIRKDNLGKTPAKKSEKDSDGLIQTGIRLNKFIANSGMCSRREADVMIQNGVVSVNGNIMDELGYRVQPTDVVKFDGRTIIPEKPVYLLLNKPKDYITTAEDPQGRRTVMALIEGACKERVFPVGRLDRNTTGLLLFTNDGEMADKLMHPRKRVKKIYMVELDKNIKTDDLKQLREGITLEDGPIIPDAVEYAEGAKLDKKVLGVEIHSGRNRIVRRMFEHFGYKVVKLDRVYLAGLTKKNLPRGHHRMLEPLEVNMLKML